MNSGAYGLLYAARKTSAELLVDEQLGRRTLVAREPRPVLHPQRAHVEPALGEEQANRRDALLARSGRAAELRAERVDEVARHHVVAVLVDAAHHLAERMRL